MFNKSASFYTVEGLWLPLDSPGIQKKELHKIPVYRTPQQVPPSIRKSSF